MPITTTILRSLENGDHSEEVIRPTFEDAFTLEYKALYASLTQGAEVKTSVVDGKWEQKPPITRVEADMIQLQRTLCCSR